MCFSFLLVGAKRMQLPPLFNFPKSQLQCFGESAYCVGSEMLERCWKAETPLARLTSVVSWSISTTRPVFFGVAPYNPILGETHHVSRGNLNFLLEQVIEMGRLVGSAYSLRLQ